MVYLARIEDTDLAEIEWKFNFSDRSLIVKDVSLRFQTSVYENGRIDVSILHNGEWNDSFGCLRQTSNGVRFFAGKQLPDIQSVRGLDSFSIVAKLSGGIGDCAWQHTQLFRQSIAAKDEYPFELNIVFHWLSWCVRGLGDYNLLL